MIFILHKIKKLNHKNDSEYHKSISYTNIFS